MHTIEREQKKEKNMYFQAAEIFVFLIKKYTVNISTKGDTSLIL